MSDESRKKLEAVRASVRRREIEAREWLRGYIERMWEEAAAKTEADEPIILSGD